MQCEFYVIPGSSPGRRPRASRPWGSGWPGRSGRKSSRWTRWPCTAAWTSARPSPRPRSVAAVPHHLIDVLDPWEEFSLARYVELAEPAAAEIAGRGRQVLFVGGTPLYSEGPLAGHFPRAAGRLGPPPAAGRSGPATRRRLAAPAAGQGRSARGRPAAPQRRPPAHPRGGGLREDRPADQRVAAAVRGGPPRGGVPVFVLDWPRAELHARIGRRVEAMFALGLVAEVRGLLPDVRRHTPCAGPAHGVCGYTSRPQPHRAAGRRLPRGDRAPGRPPQPAGNNRTSPAPHPATRQASDDLVPQPERMPVRARFPVSSTRRQSPGDSPTIARRSSARH